MLLGFEYLWVDTFRGLRDGNPQVQTDALPASSMFIKSSGKGTQQIYIEGAGKSRAWLSNLSSTQRLMKSGCGNPEYAT